MKKNLLLMLVAMTTCITGYAQEVMKVELKNGNVVTYKVEDVNRFYFTTEEIEEYADFCEVEVEDETIMTTDALFELEYDVDVEYIRFLFFRSEDIKKLSDKEIIERIMISTGSGQAEKTSNLIVNNQLLEGTEYALACVGFNEEGKNGAPMVYYFKTKVKADEEIVNIVNARYDNNYFYFDTEINDDKVLEYYLLTEVGFNLERIAESPAVIGYFWKQKIKEDEKAAGQYYQGKSFSEFRKDGATELLVYTWTRDYDLEFSGVIWENLIRANASSRQTISGEKIVAKQTGIQAYSKEELLSRIHLDYMKIKR